MKDLPKLNGARVFIRPLLVSNADDIVHFVKDNPEIPQNFSFFAGKVPSLKDERVYIRKMIESSDDAVFAIWYGDSFCGTCGLHDMDRHNDTARLGYILFNPDAHGKGIAREAVTLLLAWAFNEIEVNKVYLNAFTVNTSGISTDLALGFQFEGRLRAFYKINGEYQDVYHMSILKEEWEKG